MRFGPLPRIMTFFRSGGLRFAFGFVAGVQIRREALELRRAGIDAVEDGRDAEFAAPGRARQRHRTSTFGRARMSEMPSRLASRKVLFGSGGQRAALQLTARTAICVADLLQEPGIDGGHLVDFIHAKSSFKREADVA